MTIKIIMLAVFFAVMIGIGFYCRGHAKDVNGFVLGGRGVGPWLTAFAYGTSYFSAVVFIGYAGQFGWKFGLSATWIGVGNAFIGSLLAWLILGKRTRRMSQTLKASTMPEFFGVRFNSKSLKIAASVITFVFLIPYTASLYNGLSRLFGMAFNIDYTLCVIIMAALTGVYVIAGGYMATAINDFIQGIIMLFGIVAVVVAVLNGKGGLISSIHSMGQVSDNSIGADVGSFASLFGPSPLNLLGVVILTSLGTWGLPQMVSKFYAIKDDRSIKTGTVISTVFALIVAGGCYFLGGFGRLFSDKVNVAVSGYDSIIPAMLSGLPDILIGIVVILVLSASMSTLSSLVLTSSSTITIDIVNNNKKEKMTDKQQVSMIRILIVIFIALSVIIALVQYRSNVTFIAQLMGISWGALAGSFLAPFIYGLFWKKATSAACFVNFIFSVSFMTIVLFANLAKLSIFPPIIQSPINAGAICMVAGLIIVPIVSSFTRKPEKEVIDEAFNL